MSLVTDKFFWKALRESAEAIEVTDGRIFNTADDSVEPDEPDKTAIPYIMILNNGTQNQVESKDDGIESDYDNDSIALEIAASTREELADIAELVRKTIRKAAEEFTRDDGAELGFNLIDYTFSSSGVQFDPWKPCFWQNLNYACETENL